MRVVGRKDMENTTMLIQGPLKEETYKFYCSFYPNVPKVFSTWKENEGWLQKVARSEEKDLATSRVSKIDESTILVENEIPERFYKRQNLDLQLVSVLSGLRFVDTKYVIKLRGDEWYSNLNHVCDRVCGDEERIFFVPVFVRKWSHLPFHISDHLIAGTKENLKTMFAECLKAIFNNRILMYKGIQAEIMNYVSESMLGRFYLEKKSSQAVGLDDEHDKNLFKKHFGLIDLKELVYYKINANCSGHTWHSNFEDERSINSMEDL